MNLLPYLAPKQAGVGLNMYDFGQDYFGEQFSCPDFEALIN